MKARTKGEKRRARGRPKIEGSAREPNGRVSRAKQPADVVALEARRRHLGLPKEKLRDQKAGTFIGYLNLIGKSDGLSDDQYDAAIEYLDLRNAYLRAIQAPGRIMDGTGSPTMEITQAYEDWANRTKDQYAECRKAIQEAQNEHRRANLWAALDYCIERDERHHHMIGDLRLLCNALAKFFRV